MTKEDVMSIVFPVVVIVIPAVTALVGYRLGVKKNMMNILGCDEQQMVVCNPEKRECWCSP